MKACTEENEMCVVVAATCKITEQTVSEKLTCLGIIFLAQFYNGTISHLSINFCLSE